MMNDHEVRRVSLRAEDNPPEAHYMWAYLDADGALHVDGHDIDPGLDEFVGKDEVEYCYTVRPEHLPELTALLGGVPGGDVLDLLAERGSGPGSYTLRKMLVSGAFPVERYTH
jgi:hypothetical protein